MAQRALLVGINKYKMANSDLSGCVNDVTNIRDGLIKFFGFTIDDIRVITDDRATKKAIMERLTWLVKGAKAGDRMLFHFSGHGSQVRDREGDELKDKMDDPLPPRHGLGRHLYRGRRAAEDLRQPAQGLRTGGVARLLPLRHRHPGAPGPGPAPPGSVLQAPLPPSSRRHPLPCRRRPPDHPSVKRQF